MPEDAEYIILSTSDGASDEEAFHVAGFVVVLFAEAEYDI